MKSRELLRFAVAGLAAAALSVAAPVLPATSALAADQAADSAAGKAPPKTTEASTTPADPAAQRVQTTIDAIRAADVPLALTRLGAGPETDALGTRIDLVYVLCDRAYRYDKVVPDPAPRKALAARLFDLATAALAAAPADDRAHWAMAEAIVLRERSGQHGGPAAWTLAAEHLSKIHARKPADALPLAYAVGFLLEGACTETEATVPLSTRAGVVAAAALAVKPASPTLAITIATSQAWAARTLLATNRKAARVQVVATLESLRPFTTGATPVLEAATLWNDTLAFARRSGYVMEEKYVVTPHETLEGALAFDLPLSSRWQFQHVEATADTPAYDYVNELSAEGGRVRQILFRRYLWTQRYTFDANPVGGDNVKSLAQGLQSMITARVLSSGAAAPAADRRPFNKEMDGYVFDAAGKMQPEPGQTAPPAGLKVSGYVMRGHKQQCFAVLVYDYSSQSEPSPEIEMLIASLREPDAK
ncbi:MAG: hypothetical protein K8T90_12765 [Planctomycetes bacterium]|nr:hypothetical protein [Planctomycetota bacterium]